MLISISQRAFRKRKEQHIQDLEAKFSKLKDSQQLLRSENERLVLALKRVCIENEVLRASFLRSPTSPGQECISPPASVTHSPVQNNKSVKGKAQASGIAVNTGSSELEQIASSLETRSEETCSTEAWYQIQSGRSIDQELADIASFHERSEETAHFEDFQVASKVNVASEEVQRPKKSVGIEHARRSYLSPRGWSYLPF
jgi:hypothetical protein